jgi:two-component system response regulator LytT
VKVLKRISFWIVALLVMTFIYRSLLGGFSAALTLATLLLPGAALMSYGWNYLHRSKSRWRWLHLFYLLLFTLYIEWLGMLLSYWLVFQLNIDALPKVLVNPIFLWLYMLFFTLVEDRIFRIKVESPREDLNAPIWFEVVSERKRQQINLRELYYVESANEQIDLHLLEKNLPSKERISLLAERLPTDFLRIHRSYLVNIKLIESYSNGSICIKGQDLPISRKYKDLVEERLNPKN